MMNSVKAFIITVSDTRTLDNDVSGDKLAELLISAGAEVTGKLIVSDDLDGLQSTLRSVADREDVNLVVTTGGTGLAPRDHTPEATKAVIDKEAPGLAEAMRLGTYTTTPLSMLSRGVCGVRGETLIINLPGSPKAVQECFEIIRPVLGHAVKLISGDTEH
jgi:molybdopterin adenylyltransferase